MAKNVTAGQLTLFDLFVNVPVCDNTVVSKKPLTLAEFDNKYSGYSPSTYSEMYSIVDELAEIVKASYSGTDVFIDDFCVYHNPFRKEVGSESHNYRVSWYVQKAPTDDETKRVHCCIRRLSPVCEMCWKEGDEFTYTASAHTTKRVYSGRALTNDKSIFCERLEDIVSTSLGLLKDISSSKASSKKTKKALSPIQKFIKENDGIVIEDQLTVTSKDFKSFCTKLKNALKKEALLAGFDDVTLRPGHYDMHGFLRKGEQYIFWSYNVERYDRPTDLKCSDYMKGVLYRTAKNDKDFTGGHNHYTCLANLIKDADSLLNKGGSL